MPEQHPSIKFLQLNLNISEAAQINLLHKVNKLENYIALVTEPRCIAQKLTLVPRDATVAPTVREGSPRAAIFAAKHLLLTEITELSTRDLAAGLCQINGKRTVVISCYMDINIDIDCHEIWKALAYCDKHGYSVIIGADTNSHSKEWGNTLNNRGKKLEKLISEYSLEVSNKGRDWTYDCRLGKSIIDVTLKSKLKSRIDKWRVLKECNYSDHNTILFEVNTDKIIIPEHRNYDNADWALFTHTMNNFTIEFPEKINSFKLDNIVCKLTRGLNSALDKACPKIKEKVIDRNGGRRSLRN